MSTPLIEVTNTVPCPVIAVPTFNRQEASQIGQCGTLRNFGKYDSTSYWDQQYYDNLPDDSQKQVNVNFYIKTYGVSPPNKRSINTHRNRRREGYQSNQWSTTSRG
jgi:hypothetical protein